MGIKSLVIKGTSVRDFFKSDLSYAQVEVCLLPEWICREMVQAATKAGVITFFYPVCRPDISPVPLSLDLEKFKSTVREVKRSFKKVGILLAHPMGFSDPNVRKAIDMIGRDAIIFLDLAQSYGALSFLDQIRDVYSSYVSFNGNKLIRGGGAMKFLPHSGEADWDPFGAKFKLAFQVQRKNALDHAKSLNIGVMGYINRYLWCISNFHRVVVAKKTHPLNYGSLTTEGHGQSFHPSPQECNEPSPNYVDWFEQYYLLFPSKRKIPHCATDQANEEGCYG